MLLAGGVKGLLYLGVVLLLGAGLFAGFLHPAAPPPRLRRWLLAGALSGAVLVAVGSGLNVVTTLQAVLGFVEASFFWEYLSSTNHGGATVIRLVLVALLLAVTLPPGWAGRWRRLRQGSYLLLSGALLASFAWISHNAGMGGWLPVAADLLHLIAATAWVGALLYSALLSRLQPSLLPEVVPRVSTIGAAAVALLLPSGTYSAFLHVPDLAALTGSPYGRTLLLKLALVLGVLALAAANRWLLLPRLLRDGEASSLGRAMWLETGLLLLVLAVTGLLSVSPVPHGP